MSRKNWLPIICTFFNGPTPSLFYCLFLICSNKHHYNFCNKFMWIKVHPVYCARIRTHNLSLLPLPLDSFVYWTIFGKMETNKPWWWTSGQRVRQSEFESRWGLKFFLKNLYLKLMKIKKKRWGWPIKNKLAIIKPTFLYKWANPGLFFFSFQSFQTNNTIFTTNQCEKMSCPSSIQCQNLNPWPSEHESPPITTRPGLPSWKMKEF